MTLEWPNLIKTATRVDDAKIHIMNIQKTPTASTETVITSIKVENQLERRALKFILDNKTIFEELARL